MSLPDYYHILGVSRTASPSELKAAYRSLALQYHPDLHPNKPQAEEALKVVNQAYDVLSDAQQRRLYDAQTMPVSAITYTAPAHPVARTPHAPTVSHSLAHSQHTHFKILIKAIFVLCLISLLAVLAYIVLFQ